MGLKHLVIHELASDPGAAQNIAAGFDIGDKLRNTVSGEIFSCTGDGVWVGVSSNDRADHTGNETQLPFDATNDTLDATEGHLAYLDSEKAFVYRNDITGSSLSVGREFWVRAINNTLTPISDGTPVYEAGYDATAGVIEVEPARADDEAKRDVIGIATSTLAISGGEGEITVIGWLNDLTTTGIPEGETWAAGDILYLDLTGGFTNIRPTELPIEVAKVGKVDATTGTIFAYISRDKETIGDLTAGIEMTTTAVATTNILDGSYVLIAGTTAPTNEHRFTQSANMTVRCDTSHAVEKNIIIEISAVKTGGADREYDFALFLDGVIIPESEITGSTISASGNTVITFFTKELIAPTNLITVRVQGNGTADDIDAEVKLVI